MFENISKSLILHHLRSLEVIDVNWICLVKLRSFEAVKVIDDEVIKATEVIEAFEVIDTIEVR